MPEVVVPGIGTVVFPDNMSQADMMHAIEKQLIPQHEAHLAKTGFVPSIKSGWHGALGEAEKYIGNVAGSDSFNQWAAENAQKAQAEHEGTTTEDVTNAPGILSTIGRQLNKSIAEPIGGMIGGFGAPVAIGAVAGLTAPLWAPEAALGAVGAAGIGAGVGTLAGLPTQAGENIQRSEELGQQPDLIKATAAGLFQSALMNITVPGMGLATKGISKVLGEGLEAKATGMARKVIDGTLSKDAAIEALSGYGQQLARNTAINAVTGTTMMVGTEAARRAQAGQDLTSPEAMSAYGDQATTALELSPILGGFHGIGERGRAKDILSEADMRNQKITQINDARKAQDEHIQALQDQGIIDAQQADAARQQAEIDRITALKVAQEQRKAQLKGQIDAVTGVSNEPAGNSRQGFVTAWNEKTGIRVSDPETNFERELTMGEYHKMLHPELFADDPVEAQKLLEAPKKLVYPDGTVAYAGEAEKAIAQLPESQQVAARAKLLGFKTEPVAEVPGIVTPKIIPTQELINRNLGIDEKGHTTTEADVKAALNEKTGARVNTEDQIERPETADDMLKRNNPDAFNTAILPSLPPLDKSALNHMGFQEGKAGYAPMLKLGKDPIGNADKINDILDTHLRSNKTLNKEAINTYRSIVDEHKRLNEAKSETESGRQAGEPSVRVSEQRATDTTGRAEEPVNTGLGDVRLPTSEPSTGETGATAPLATPREQAMAEKSRQAEQARIAQKAAEAAAVKAEQTSTNIEQVEAAKRVAADKALSAKQAEADHKGNEALHALDTISINPESTKADVAAVIPKFVEEGTITPEQAEAYKPILADKETTDDHIIPEVVADVKKNIAKVKAAKPRANKPKPGFELQSRSAMVDKIDTHEQGLTKTEAVPEGQGKLFDEQGKPVDDFKLTSRSTMEDRAIEAENATAPEVSLAQGKLFDEQGNPTTEAVVEPVTTTQHQILEAPVNALPAQHVAKLEQVYQAKRSSPEFMAKLHADVIRYAADGVRAISKAIRAIIRAVYNGILATSFIMNPHFISNYSEAIVIPHHMETTVTKTTRTVKAEIPAGASKMSEGAKESFQTIFPAIQAELKAKNKFFIVTDKPAAQMYIFNPDGSLFMNKKVLIGATKGDYYKGNTDVIANRITPAGLFKLGLRDATRSEGEAHTAGAYDYKKVFVLDKAIEGEWSVTLFHSVWTHETDASRRLAALKNDSASDSRYSFGCINVDKTSFGHLINEDMSKMDGASLFIVPDNKANVGEFLTGESARNMSHKDDLTRTTFTPKTTTDTTSVTKSVPGTPRAAPSDTLLFRHEDQYKPKVEEARGAGRATGQTADTVRQRLHGEFGEEGISSLEKRGILTIVNSVDELPAHIREALDPTAMAAHSEGKAYLIADRVAPENVRRALLHEVGEHYGLKAMIGDTAYKNILDTIHRTAHKDPVMLEAINHVSISYPELQADPAQFAREVIARVGETAPTHTVWRRIVAAIKNFLVKQGFKTNISSADIHDLVQHSLRTAMKRDITAERGGTEASKQLITSSPKFKRWFGNSKIVDAEGKPLVVYHGTKRDFSEFKPKYADNLSFFSTNSEFASKWAVGAGGLRENSPENQAHYEELRKLEKELGQKYIQHYNTEDPNWIAQYDADKAKLRAEMSKLTGFNASATYENNAGNKVMPVYLSIKNPFHPEHHYKEIENLLKTIPSMRNVIESGIHKKGNWVVYENPTVINYLKSKGYDGIWLNEVSNGPHETIAAFNPNQIKSAIGNNGEFNPNDARIEFAKPTAKRLDGTDIEYPAPYTGSTPEPIRKLMNGEGTMWERLGKQLNATKIKAGMGIVSKRYSIEKKALDNGIAAMSSKVQGVLRGDLIAQQADNAISLSHSGMHLGGLRVMPSGMVEAYADTANPANMVMISDAFHSLVAKATAELGDKDVANDMITMGWNGPRYESLIKRNEDLDRQINQLRTNKPVDWAKDAKKLEDNKVSTDDWTASSRRTAAEAERRYGPELAHMKATWNIMRERLVKFMVEAENMTDTQAREYVDNMDYVPFYRMPDEELVDHNNYPKTGASLQNAGKKYKLKGSEKKLNDPMSNLQANISWMMQKGIQNNAALHLTKLLEQMNEGHWVDADNPPVKDHTITIWKDGKAKGFVAHDINDVAAFGGNPIITGMIWDIARASTNLLRHGVTMFPQFVFNQAFEDPVRAAFVSGNQAGMLRNLADTWFSIYKNQFTKEHTEGAEALYRSGVIGQKDIMGESEVADRYMGKDKKGIKKALFVFERLAQGSDLGSREAIYKNAMKELKDQGYDEGTAHALATSRAIQYMPYQQVGTSKTMAYLRTMMPFVNSPIQGYARDIAAARGRISGVSKAQGQKMVAMRLAKYAAFIGAYAAFNSGNPDYEKQDADQRDNYFFIGGMRIPAPQELRPFKAAIERGTRAYALNAPGADLQSSDIGAAILHKTWELVSGVALPIPTVIKPVIEGVTNYNIRTGHPLVGAGLSALEPYLQYNDSTSEIGKLIGNMLNVAPIKVDNFITGYGGYLGQTVEKFSNALVAGRPTQNVNDWLFVGSLIEPEFGTGNKSETYKLVDKVATVKATIKNLKDKGDVEGLKEYVSKNRGFIGAEDSVSVLHQRITDIHNSMAKVNNMKISDDEKQARLNVLRTAENNGLAKVHELHRKIVEFNNKGL